MLYTVTMKQSDYIEVDFGAIGIMARIQALKFILSTVLNSCPLARDQGWTPDLDAPIQLAPALNTAAIINAIEYHDAGITIEEVNLSGNPTTGTLAIELKVNIDE